MLHMCWVYTTAVTLMSLCLRKHSVPTNYRHSDRSVFRATWAYYRAFFYFGPLTFCSFLGSAINGTEHAPKVGVCGLKNPRKPTSPFASFLVSEGPDATTCCSPWKLSCYFSDCWIPRNPTGWQTYTFLWNFYPPPSAKYTLYLE